MSGLLTSLASPEATTGWAQFVSFCQSVYFSTPFRLAVVIVLVGVTIWAIAKVYSGELQNAEKGPVAIRRHKGTVGSIPRDTVVVHRDLINLTMDGCHARCTVMYVYEGYKDKRVHVPLITRQVRLSVQPARLSDKVQGIARANEVPDVRQEEVYWPVLDVEIDAPTVGEKTAERAQDYAIQHRIHDRWSGDDDLSLISVHEDLLEEIVDARRQFISERVERARKAKSGNWLQKFINRGAAKNRPGAVGNYYLKFQFSNDPIFVLTRHPDRDVRMTAWLTLLTSAFAVLVELFPLQPTPPPGVVPIFGAPAHTDAQSPGPRSRPRPIVP